MSTGLSSTNSNVVSLSTGLSTANTNINSLSTSLSTTNSNLASLSTSTSQKASSTQFGIVEVDGTTITSSAGVISAVGGGGGGGGATYTPPVLSNFTQVNLPSGGTTTSITGGIQMYAPALSSGFNLSTLLQATPSTPYTKWLRMSFGGSPGVQYSNFGLALSDSTNKIVTYDFFAGGSSVYVGEMAYETYSSATSRNSFAGNIPATTTAPPLIGVNDDGTNLNFLISYDGVTYFKTYTVSRTAYLSAGPTKIGFFVNGYSQPITANFVHWAANLPGPL